MWGDWVWFAGAALGITTTLVGIVYMLSELLMNDKMKSWAKMELAEIFYSAIIISMAVVALPTIDGVVQGAFMVSNTGTGGVAGAGMPCAGTVTSTWVPTTDYGVAGSKHYTCQDICGPGIAASPTSVYHGVESCHMRLGIWYMRELFDETKTFAYDTYLSYINTAMIAAFSINIEFVFEAAGFFTMTPWAGFYTIGNAIKATVFDWAVKIMMLLKFQEVLLYFIATALFPALFVSGALLRTFPFTRKLGGLLLAMAITFYFIFPAFYAFGALVMLDIKHNPQVINAWFNSPANPANRLSTQAISTPIAIATFGTAQVTPQNFPDPPIANMMYINGSTTMHIPGGSYSAGDSEVALYNLEGMDSKDYYALMEDGKNQGYMPGFDLGASQTEQQTDAALTSGWNSAQTWLGSVSKESKLDNFLNVAWKPNGPVDSMARLTFWSAFFSFISIIATIAGIRSLAVTFGGDIEIAGLTRLI